LRYVKVRPPRAASDPEPRPHSLATLQGDDATYAPLAAAPPRARVLRTALLQRFNTLLAKHLALVHTGSARETASLGGRLCALRGLVFFELKHGALKPFTLTTYTLPLNT